MHLEGETPWLMYEYVPGGDLGDLILKWHKLESEQRVVQVVAAVKQISTAVAHFHKLSPVIVHRDLKPSNILLLGSRWGMLPLTVSAI
jgi:serine/threonine protein kinase